MNLLERQAQLDVLERRFEEARAGSGKMVLVAGEAGFGKSSLVERFASGIRGEARVLWGACDALATPRALGPVNEIAGQTPLFDSRADAAGESRDWLFAGLFKQLAPPERATLVVLEDVQWADESTLDFLRFIGRRIQRTVALFIATYRDEDLSPRDPVRYALGELTGRHVTRLRLPPLSLAAVAELANDSGRDAQQLHHITGGNPFFVNEALASPDESVPETVRDAIIARLMRCSASTRELVEFVSISPGQTPGWLIESTLGARESAVDEAVGRGLLAVHGDAVGFRHELARLAVHSTLPPERARVLHDRAFAAWIEHGADLTALVHHATLAKNAAGVLEYAPLAAREAARLGAHREAAAHLSAALCYCERLPPAMQAELFEQHAYECSVMNQAGAAIVSANRALALCRGARDIKAQSRVLCFLTVEYRITGDNVRADASISGAIALLEPLPRSVDLGRAYAVRARLASNRGLDAEAVDFGERALVLAREFSDRATESRALNYIGSALLIAGDRAGYALLERSLAVALESGFEEGAALAYANLAFCATLNHDLVRAQRHLDEGITYSEERGLYSQVAYLQAYGARLALDRGEWSAAAWMAADLSQTCDLVAIQRVPVGLTLALVRIRRGDPGADALLDEVYDLALSMQEPERIGRVTAARAEAAWYRGDLAGVARETAIGLQRLADRGIPWVKGELLFWQSRANGKAPDLQHVAEPYRLMLVGDWRAAAAAWERIGMPYETALSLAGGSGEALLRSLAILERLGASPLETIVRNRLRELGVRRVPRGPRQTTRANPAGLSATELAILALLAEGCSNAEIARRVSRSTRTIDHHVSAVLAKLEVRSRTEAIAAALALGIVGAPSDAAGSPRN